jgi:hypothetical protein
VKQCGVKVYYRISGTGAYTQLTGVKKAKMPEDKYGTVDDEDLDTCDTPARSMGKHELGDASFSVRYTDAKKTAIEAIKAQGEIEWRMEYPLDTGQSTAAKVEFDGFISAENTSEFSDGNQPVLLDGTIALTTVPVWTAGN